MRLISLSTVCICQCQQYTGHGLSIMDVTHVIQTRTKVRREPKSENPFVSFDTLPARGDPPYFTQTWQQFLERKEYEKKRQHENEPRAPSIISVHSSDSDREQERKRQRLSRSPSVEIIGQYFIHKLVIHSAQQTRCQKQKQRQRINPTSQCQLRRSHTSRR